MKIRAQWFTQPEHPESSSPNPESIPNSCWFCGFAAEGDIKTKKDEDKKDKRGDKCVKCGMWTLENPTDPVLMTDPAAQDGPMESSVVVTVSKKVAVDFSKGLTPASIRVFLAQRGLLRIRTFELANRTMRSPLQTRCWALRMGIAASKTSV